MHNLTEKKKNFTEIIYSNQWLIIKVARLYTNKPEDEEDLTQEIVLQLWKSFDRFRGESKISTWMYRIALNTAITLYRKKSKLPVREMYEEEDFSELKASMYDYETEEDISLLYKVIKELPDVERAIVTMYLDDCSYREIAENLGITEGNARVKMNRLKKILKEKMERYGKF